MSSTAESAIPAKPYHRKRSSKLKFPDSQEIEQKEKPMPEETVVREKDTRNRGDVEVQPFAELVYQWNVVQGQGDPGLSQVWSNPSTPNRFRRNCWQISEIRDPESRRDFRGFQGDLGSDACLKGRDMEGYAEMRFDEGVAAQS
eukprot:1042899-Amorphochlora_amoeboformis.AAC.1